MKNITCKEFTDAFCEEWKKNVKKDRDKVLDSFAENRRWTDYMLCYGGFLNSVLDNLKHNYPALVYWRELYTIDAVYITGPDLLHCQELSYPSELNVALEHENGGNPEKELWKLAYWRTPLKVLIFYDYNEYQKEDSKPKRDWLGNKLQLMEEVLDTINRFWTENDLTEYLLLIGNSKQRNSLPIWRMTTRTSNKVFSELKEIE